MKHGALIAVVLALASGPLRADPSSGGDLALKDGRVLHHASVLRDEGDGLVIRADEGLVKVARDLLPEAPADSPQVRVPDRADTAPLVMRPFNPDQAPADSPAAPVPVPSKPPAKPASPAPQRPRPAASPEYKGCTIASFQVKAYQGVLGCVEVVVRNPTDQIVILRPWDFACVTAEGARHVGRNIITDGYPPHLKRREVVPQQGEIDDIVTFTDTALDNPVVVWSH